MTGRRYSLAGLTLVVVLAGGMWARTTTLVVAPGESVQAAVDGAAPGSSVVLSTGTHWGPVSVDASVALRGEPGAVLHAPADAPAAIAVTASGVRIASLRVEGAETGILVREVEGVAIDDVRISSAELHGIEVVDGSAVISDVVVEDMIHPMAQGIEIRNSDGRPDTIITRANVTGGQEGIVSHVSEVEISDSYVTDTTLRGITITEMSDGIVSGNTVVDAAGSGFYCGDMSRCAFSNNAAPDVAAGHGGTSSAGWGLVVTYHSSAWSHDNDFGGAAGPLMTSMGSHMRDRSPLDPRSPTVLIVPLALAVLIAVAVGAAGYFGGRVLRRRGTPVPPMLGPIGGLAAFVIALGVQSFHMVEHWLQVYRVHVDLIPSRGGLVGPSVEAEWVHLAYNGTLWFLLLLVLFDLRRGATDGRVALVGGAVLIQGWHSIEHTAKIIQHITTGAKVNPGVLGSLTDLVWFHFTINLTVYGLCLAAGLLWFNRLRRPGVALTTRPVPA